jgi:4-amino-4-deoxy-L-arabinose transferase-like glycosyltransferase
MNEAAPPSAKPRRNTLVVLALILLAGSALRIFGPPAFKTAGYDEFLYRKYVNILHRFPITVYPRVIEMYNEKQIVQGETELPPTRFLYIFCGWSWMELFHTTPIDALHAVSCLFSVLMLPLAAVFAFRLGGDRSAVGVMALVAFSPLQICVSRHALIDGFFGFWAVLCVWLLWENLRKPAHSGWLAAYTASLALMVLTKENAFFVFFAIMGLLALNPWVKFGTVTRSLVLCTFGGGLLGVTVISLLAGGLDNAMQVYLLLVQNASHFSFAIETGDGPWHRYLCELLLMSPMVWLLAVGAVFQLTRERKSQIYLLCFIAFSYLVMCNVRYGMNLRYTNMWDMPLRYLAFWQLTLLCGHFGKRKDFVLALCLVAICACDLRQYYVLFVKYYIYEPIPLDVVHALKILG